MIEARAPAKIIISGEHFVVHGSHALAASINRYVTVSASKGESDELVAGGRSVKADHIFNSLDTISKGRHVKLVVRSQVPNGAGLGSSAALSLASAIAVSKLFDVRADPSLLYEVSMEAERQIHGKPSGVDVAASLYGGFLLFKRGEIKVIRAPPMKFLILDSRQRRITGKLVSQVGKFMDSNPELFEQLIRASDSISLNSAEAMEKRNYEQVALYMNLSQMLLELIGVSTPKLRAMIKELRDKVLGAKITGAGGGGCIIAVPRGGNIPPNGYIVEAGVDGAYKINYGVQPTGSINL